MNPIRTLAATLVLASLTVAQAAPARPESTKPQPLAVAQAASPRVIMGITMEALDEALAEQLGIDEDEAVLVDSVTPGYGAAKAGLKKHDVIVRLDGKGPVNPDSLRKVLGKKKPGDHVKVGVIRSGENKEFDVELMEAKDQGGMAAMAPEPAKPANPSTAEPRGNPARPGQANTRTLFGESMQRRESDEQVRESVAKLREQLRTAEAEIGKRARDLARDSAKMAEDLARQAAGKYDAAKAEEKFQRLAETFRDHSERQRQRLEIDLRDALEQQRDQLDRAMANLEKQLAKLRTAELGMTRSLSNLGPIGWMQAGGAGPSAPVGPGAQAGGSGGTGGGAGGQGGWRGPVSGSGSSGATAPAQVPFNSAPVAVLGDGGAKALKKVEDRLSSIEERLTHIEEMCEKLLARTATKSPK